jgi:hypothetical protein
LIGTKITGEAKFGVMFGDGGAFSGERASLASCDTVSDELSK